MSTPVTFQIETSLEIEITIYDQDDAVVDLTEAVVLEVRIQDPRGITSVKNATLSSDGTDGKIKYVCVPADTPVEGTYRIQGRAVFPDEIIYSSNIAEIIGIKNL
jgi:hypothetical protein